MEKLNPTIVATDNISKLADRPTISAADLKATFDKSGTDIKKELEDVIIPKINDIITFIGDTNNVMSADAVQEKIDAQIKKNNVGDMAKVDYDTDEDGIVDKAALAENATNATNATNAENAVQAEKSSSLIYETRLITYKQIIDSIYPKGCLYISIENSSPANRFPWQTWKQMSQGRTLLGVGAVESNTSTSFGNVSANEHNFGTVNVLGGEYSHKLSVNEMPSHTHTIEDSTMSSASDSEKKVEAGNDVTVRTKGVTATETTSATGGNVAHNNLPPYVTVYMWRRTN